MSAELLLLAAVFAVAVLWLVVRSAGADQGKYEAELEQLEAKLVHLQAEGRPTGDAWRRPAAAPPLDPPARWCRHVDHRTLCRFDPFPIWLKLVCIA